MDTKFELETETEADTQATEREIVYVRPVLTDELPEKLRAHIGRAKTVYSVHSAQGEQLALVKDRHLAFALARQHDLAPVNVH